MLSLLSLLLASGTVLRADTEEWTPLSYPDPRVNYTECNTWSNSTLCDPDHILTDQWREQINNNLNGLMEKLRRISVEYAESAPFQCYDNSTDGLQLYVILAKRIQAARNQTISEADLTKFGDGIVEQFGLKDLQCKNFLIFIGVETAKMAYVRTGSDLKLPADLMEHIFNKYNLFKAKNFMEVLNKIVNEIGDKISEPPAEFSPQVDTKTLMEDVVLFNDSLPAQNLSAPAAGAPPEVQKAIPWWIFLLLGSTCSSTLLALLLLLYSRQRNRQLKLLTAKAALAPCPAPPRSPGAPSPGPDGQVGQVTDPPGRAV